MKTVFSIVFVFVLFHSQFYAQTVGSVKSVSSIRPIRSLKIVNFNCSFSSATCSEKPSRTQVILYDREENEIERTLYKADETIEHQVKNSYFANGLQKSWKEHYGKGVANAEGLNKRAFFTYRAGKLAEVIVYREDSIAHKSIYVYDSRGNKIQEINSGSDAVFTGRNYKYDTVGNLIEESNSSKLYSTKTERIYDNSGNVIKERFFENDSLKTVFDKIYENGKLIKIIGFKPDGSLLSTTQNVYNRAGKLIETHLSGENLTIKTTTEYDETGAMKTKEVITVYKDNGNHKNRRIISSHDPTPGRLFITYNKKELETGRIQYSETGGIIYKQTLSYDDSGRLAEFIYYKATGEVESRLIYEYDGYGNRIKTSSAAVSPIGEVRYLTLEERVIKYW